MQNNKFEENVKALKSCVDKIVLDINMLDNNKKEEFLRNCEKIRYEIFDSIQLENKYSYKQDIDFVNNNYKVQEKDGILKITIPEVLPKYKNISNPAYKNILLNVSNSLKDYKQANMDIDNKYIKPIIDALVVSQVVKDDNFTNIFYGAMGKNDTTKPFTEVYVLDGMYLLAWINMMQNLF